MNPDCAGLQEVDQKMALDVAPARKGSLPKCFNFRRVEAGDECAIVKWSEVEMTAVCQFIHGPDITF